MLIKIFPTTPKAHYNSSENFQARFNLIFSEEIIQYSRTFALQVQTSWNQSPCNPSSLKAFLRHQEHDLKHPNSMDLLTTKKNKLFLESPPEFIFNCSLVLCLMTTYFKIFAKYPKNIWFVSLTKKCYIILS